MGLLLAILSVRSTNDIIQKGLTSNYSLHSQVLIWGVLDKLCSTPFTYTINDTLNLSQGVILVKLQLPPRFLSRVTLLKREDVQARLEELRQATADEAIMSVIERKRRLSQIARARYDDPDREGDPIAAIHQLNLMDGVYSKKVEVVAPGVSSTVVVVEPQKQH